MQPPPPPPLETGTLSLHTITVMIMLTFLMQGSAIAVNSVLVREYKGVRLAFLATLALALGFAVLLFIGQFPLLVTGALSNLLIILGHALIYLAICRFMERPPNPYLIFGLLPLGVAALAFLTFSDIRGIPLNLATQFVGFPLNIASAAALLRGDRRRYRLGATLTALPLLTYGLLTIVRIIAGLLAPREILPGATLANLFDVLALYVLSYLWIAGFILMISQRLQSDLNDLAMNDALTRVRNRRAMQGMLDFEMRRVHSEPRDFSVILLDVDHFKRVNDTHGHDVGDAVLRWLAQTLQSGLRVQDIVARWGGEEFLILLPDTSLQEAVETAERLRRKVEAAPVQGAPDELKVTFSAGVSNSKTNRDVNQLCKVADQALYAAKQTRNRVVSQEQI